MSYLTVEVVKKSCAFVLQIREPADSLKRLVLFFQDRHILIDNLHMHRYRSGDATLIIHCQIEKDRTSRTVDLLEKLPGVMEVEMLK